MLKAEDTETLTVGKFYLVKHAVLRDVQGSTYRIPIYGEKHKDPQFGVHEEHYHIDGRFVSTKDARHGWQFDKNGKTNGVVPVKNHFREITSYEYRVKKCKRLTTGILPPKNNKSYLQWYSQYLGHKCKGKRCPHFGTKMLQQGDNLVCPLHNIIADINTLEVLPFNQ